MASALKWASSTSTPRPWPSSSEPRGLAHYISKYDSARPPLSAVREYADTSLELYDYELALKKQAMKSQYKKGEAIVDEDGFTLVTRGGAYGQTVGGGAGVASKKFELERGKSQSRKKKLPKEKKMFYAFQVNETKRSGAYIVLAVFSYLFRFSFRVDKAEARLGGRQGKDSQIASSQKVQAILMVRAITITGRYFLLYHTLVPNSELRRFVHHYRVRFELHRRARQYL